MLKKLFFIVPLLLSALILYGAGTPSGGGTTTAPHLIRTGVSNTVAFMDTLVLYGDGDSDTLDYSLSYGRDSFCNGLITAWMRADTAAADCTESLAATDSLYVLLYPGNRQGWRGVADTLRFESMTTKGPGLDWTPDVEAQGSVSIPRSEALRVVVTQESSDGDTINVILRMEWGIR